MRYMCLAALPVLLMVGIGADSAKPEFTFHEFKRAKDSVTVRLAKQQAVFTVKSPSGIGAVTVKLKSGQWPRDVVVLLAGFRMLEQFTVTTDRLSAECSLKRSGRASFYFRSAQRKPGERRAAAGTLNIRIEKAKEGIRIVLPASMCAGSKQIKLHWIDAFRG
jgi:hypothetical protein